MSRKTRLGSLTLVLIAMLTALFYWPPVQEAEADGWQPAYCWLYAAIICGDDPTAEPEIVYMTSTCAATLGLQNLPTCTRACPSCDEETMQCDLGTGWVKGADGRYAKAIRNPDGSSVKFWLPCSSANWCPDGGCKDDWECHCYNDGTVG